MTDSRYPVLDSPRTVSNDEFDRVVIDEYGAIQPYVEERDWWCTTPLRLMHDLASNFCIEVGPYTLGHRDIERLRAAIRCHDEVIRGSVELR